MQTDNITTLAELDRGHAARRAGRYEEAIRAYQAALLRAPGDPEIVSFLGLAMAQAGEHHAALRLLEQAVAAAPDEARFRLNLAAGLLIEGMTNRARTEVQTVLQRHPASPHALELLGDIAARQLDMESATRHWRQALATSFSLPLAIKIVREMIRTSQFDAAKGALGDLIPHFKSEPAIHALNCELQARLRDWPSVRKIATFMTSRFPADREGWQWLATALLEAGRYPDAAAAYRRIIEMGEPSADELAAYAGLCVHALAFDDARAALDAAMAIDPEHPGVLQRRAMLHLNCGQFAAAEDCSRRCLARDPGNVSAFTTLTRVRRGQLDDADLAALLCIVERSDAPVDNRIPAAFAVGHVYDARGDVDAAFAAYRRAHELALERDRLEGRIYDRAASEARAAQLPAQLELEPLAARPSDLPRPIFIVGMPRSGTTLAECLLGAHPAVVPCGERMATRQVLHVWLDRHAAGRDPDAATLAAWRDAVLHGLPDPGAARHFTDKHPLNFEAVGLIARLFPDAAIVWMRRDPLETCLSVYRQEFNKRWAFVHRLAAIGHYYRLHERVMARWMERLPGRITVVRYESLAADLVRHAPALLAAVGLDWDPHCLEFQSSERPIATFSSVDVRDPVTVRQGRGARYRPHLDELMVALAAAPGAGIPDGEDDAVTGPQSDPG